MKTVKTKICYSYLHVARSCLIISSKNDGSPICVFSIRLQAILLKMIAKAHIHGILKGITMQQLYHTHHCLSHPERHKVNHFKLIGEQSHTFSCCPSKQ